MVTQNITYRIPELDRLSHLTAGRAGAPQAPRTWPAPGKLRGRREHSVMDARAASSQRKGPTPGPSPKIVKHTEFPLLSRRGRERLPLPPSGRKDQGRRKSICPPAEVYLLFSCQLWFAVSVSGTASPELSGLNAVRAPAHPMPDPPQGPTCSTANLPHPLPSLCVNLGIL